MHMHNESKNSINFYLVMSHSSLSFFFKKKYSPWGQSQPRSYLSLFHLVKSSRCLFSSHLNNSPSFPFPSSPLLLCLSSPLPPPKSQTDPRIQKTKKQKNKNSPHPQKNNSIKSGFWTLIALFFGEEGGRGGKRLGGMGGWGGFKELELSVCFYDRRLRIVWGGNRRFIRSRFCFCLRGGMNNGY